MKSARQIAILDIIAENAIDTQEELADALRAHGCHSGIGRGVREGAVAARLRAELHGLLHAHGLVRRRDDLLFLHHRGAERNEQVCS